MAPYVRATSCIMLAPGSVSIKPIRCPCFLLLLIPCDSVQHDLQHRFTIKHSQQVEEKPGNKRKIIATPSKCDYSLYLNPVWC